MNGSKNRILLLNREKWKKKVYETHSLQNKYSVR